MGIYEDMMKAKAAVDAAPAYRYEPEAVHPAVLSRARAESKAFADQTLANENRQLRDEISLLQAKFDIAHAALGVAVDECERLTGELTVAIKGRDS